MHDSFLLLQQGAFIPFLPHIPYSQSKIRTYDLFVRIYSGLERKELLSPFRNDDDIRMLLEKYLHGLGAPRGYAPGPIM